MPLVVTSAPPRVASRSPASTCAPAVSSAVTACRRLSCSQPTTSRRVPPETAAASRVPVRTCSAAAVKNGSLRAPDRVVRKCPASRAAASTRAGGSASRIARSGSHHQVCSANAICCGSKVHTGPTRARSPAVSAHRSALLEVATTGPGADSTVGTATALVLFARGPMMIRATSSQDIHTSRPPHAQQPHPPRPATTSITSITTVGLPAGGLVGEGRAQLPGPRQRGGPGQVTELAAAQQRPPRVADLAAAGEQHPGRHQDRGLRHGQRGGHQQERRGRHPAGKHPGRAVAQHPDQQIGVPGWGGPVAGVQERGGAGGDPHVDGGQHADADRGEQQQRRERVVDDAERLRRAPRLTGRGHPCLPTGTALRLLSVRPVAAECSASSGPFVASVRVASVRVSVRCRRGGGGRPGRCRRGGLRWG